MNKKKIIKLHLGCGTITPDDWINIDGSWNAWLAKHSFLKLIIKQTGLINKDLLEISWSKNIKIYNLTKPLPFKSNSVDFIYSSHTLEHLYFFQATNLLRECYRILKPGGVLRIMVPDLHKHIEDYLSDKKSKKSELKTSGDRFLASLLILPSKTVNNSFASRIYNYLNNTNSHKWMYDRESLMNLFKTTGFKNSESKELFKSKIPGIEEVEPSFRFAESACVEGAKSV